MNGLDFYKNKYKRKVEDYEGKNGSFWKEEADKNIELINETHINDNVVRWNNNNRIPPVDLLVLWDAAGKKFDLLKSIQAAEKENTATVVKIPIIG